VAKLRSLRIAAALAVVAGVVTGSAGAQSDVRSPLPAPVKARLGMANVPALSPLWLLPEYVAKYNVQMETVLFQRFADARTALAAGDLDVTAFGPQDIALALGQGAKSLVGIAGLGSGNDCLVVRRGDDVKDWKALAGRSRGSSTHGSRSSTSWAVGATI
jgi:sulfonate transport system substrate-binding protein